MIFHGKSKRNQGIDNKMLIFPNIYFRLLFSIYSLIYIKEIIKNTNFILRNYHFQSTCSALQVKAKMMIYLYLTSVALRIYRNLLSLTRGTVFCKSFKQFYMKAIPLYITAAMTFMLMINAVCISFLCN